MEVTLSVTITVERAGPEMPARDVAAALRVAIVDELYGLQFAVFTAGDGEGTYEIRAVDPAVSQVRKTEEDR